MTASDGNAATEWVPTGSATVHAPGRLNLHLAVGATGAGGRREVTTVFHAVSLSDEVTVRTADALSIDVTGEGADTLPTDRRNMAWRAAALMADHVGRSPDVAITVNKALPVSGGMAGASSDAAAVLVAMNELWDLRVPRRDLHALAVRLGADVPFALHGGTALGAGHGAQLATVLTRDSFHWVLTFAERGLVTSRVFAELERLRRRDRAPARVGEAEPVLAALAAGDADRLAPLLGNDLESAAVSLQPPLRRTMRAGMEAGALAAMVAGSGPTCAFLCASATAATDVALELARSGTCRAVRVASGPAPGARVVSAGRS